MKNFGAKFRLIFIPFLLITVILVFAYTFLHWLLFIKNIFFNVDEEIINLIVPMILPGIPILIWLRPRIKLLNLATKNKRRDPLSGYIMLAWIAMAAPTIIAQEYIVTSTGKLTPLDHISQIDSLPSTKYYTLKHYYIDKRLVRTKTTFETSGRYNENFEMTIYTPCPIFDYNHVGDTAKSQQIILKGNRPLIVVNGIVVAKGLKLNINPKNVDKISVLKGTAAKALYGDAAIDGVIFITTKSPIDTTNLVARPDGNLNVTPVAWLAIKYEETISNNLPGDRKEDMYNAFLNKTQREFDAKSFNKFSYLDRINYSTDLKNYTAAITNNKYTALSTPVIVLSPVSERFEDRNGNEFPWIFGSMGIGSLVFMITLLFKPLRTNIETIDLTAEAKKDRSSFLMWLKALLIPQKGHFVMQLLIQANLLIFIIMVCTGLGFISFDSADLLKWGADYRPLVVTGEYWRLLTCIFLHEGLMHVLLNMYALFFVGIFLEPVIGSTKFAITYFITGIIASFASIWWHPASVGIGASGAIFGMYGVFLALLTTNIFPRKLKKPFLISTSFFIVYNLLFGIIGNVDNAAHIGGLISGLICGYCMYPMLKNKLSSLDLKDDTQKIIDELTGKHSNKNTDATEETYQ
jgi:rhomboid protease GluP